MSTILKIDARGFGKPEGVTVSVRDMTPEELEQRQKDELEAQAEAALRAEEDKRRAMQEKLIDALIEKGLVSEQELLT